MPAAQTSIQFPLDEGRRASGAGAEINVYVLLDGGTKNPLESSCDESGWGGELDDGELESPEEGQAGLNFGAEVRGEPGKDVRVRPG